MRIPQEIYAAAALESRLKMRKAAAEGTPLAALVKEARGIIRNELSKMYKTQQEGKPLMAIFDDPTVKKAGRELIKAGITTSLGFNFFDLRGPAYMIFPLLTPFIQMIGKAGKVNAGVGTAAHWKATLNPNATFNYVGLIEGQRGPISTPNERDYLATYKELGMDAGETFTAQWAGEGYTDNLADEHFRNLARLRLSEEMMTIWGNSGTATGNLGFALGQPPNVSSVTVNSAVGFGANSNIVVGVVAITGQGMNPGGQAGYAAPPSVANGITTSYLRTNADGTSQNVQAGTSPISNISANITVNITGTSLQAVNVSIPAMKGAVAYAWYWGVNVGSTAASVKIGAITAWPWLVITAAASGTQTGAATGITNDNSYQPTDFDGLATYSFLNGQWTDMGGGSFTPAGNGQVKEIENDLQFFWNNFQTQPDGIWVSADVRYSLEQAVIFSATSTNSYIFNMGQNTQADGIVAGFVVSGYKSKYAIGPSGSAVIPIRLHPQMPQGTLLYDLSTNPYPHSKIPASRQFLLQRDYYAIEWPVVTRQWTFGTYIHEVLAHYTPQITAIRTGVGSFVAPCWIAAVVFGEDYATGFKTNLVRNYLLDWEKRSGLGKIVVGAYRLVGQRVAKATEKSGLLKRAFTKLFNYALNKAQATA